MMPFDLVAETSFPPRSVACVHIGLSFIAITLICYGLTTVIIYCYMAETNVRFVFGNASNRMIHGVRTSGGHAGTMVRTGGDLRHALGSVGSDGSDVPRCDFNVLSPLRILWRMIMVLSLEAPL